MATNFLALFILNKLGTLNVLNAAFNAKVSRVVVTSSTASVNTAGFKNKVFTEDDWAG